MRFLNSQDEFERAIRDGVLSRYSGSPRYAGLYMYMGTRDDGQSLFKHVVTRQYLNREEAK